MIASGCIAPSVFNVSTSDSPFDTLDPWAVIEIVSAPRRLAAISKLVRVRVDASKKRLTTILPFRMSSFRQLFSATGRNSRARSKIVWISSRERGAIPNKPAGFSRVCNVALHGRGKRQGNTAGLVSCASDCAYL